ncbi:MAG TPA: Rad52/Rad22 family DNA repair protein [Pyrinomonadaceae bacterium]
MNVTSFQTDLKERRAKAIAGMGLVTRVGDHFTVSSPSVKANQKSNRVWRNETNNVVCDCTEFSSALQSGSPTRCEHILAVKFALMDKNTEPSARPELTATASLENSEGASNNTESRRSERGEQTTDQAKSEETAYRQAASPKVELDRVENKHGDQKMKRNNLTEIEEAAVPASEDFEPRSNVLEFSNTLRELKKHVDPNLIKQREGWRDRNGNVQMVDYVEWHTVADILDETAPNWAHTVKDIRQIGDLMTVTVAITIDGVTREGIGTGLAQSEMGIKKAEHDALKRAAVKFGIARELYKKESEAIEREGSASPNDGGDDFPSNPVARSLGELVTAKQLGMIRAIARELNIDPDEECNSVMSCSTDELTKRAASALIQHLQEMQKSNSSATPPLKKAG